MPAKTPATPDTALIAETAYGIWLEEGQPHGRDAEHWFAAIERLKALKPKAKRAAPKKAAAPKAAPKAAAAKTKAAPKKAARLVN